MHLGVKIKYFDFPTSLMMSTVSKPGALTLSHTHLLTHLHIFMLYTKPDVEKKTERKLIWLK